MPHYSRRHANKSKPQPKISLVVKTKRTTIRQLSFVLRKRLKFWPGRSAWKSRSAWVAEREREKIDDREKREKMRDGWALVEETFALGDRKKTQILKTGFHLLLFVLLRLFNTHHLRGGAPHTHTSVRHPLA